MIRVRKEAIRLSFLRTMERWRSEPIDPHGIPLAVPEDVRSRQLFRFAGFLGLLGEAALLSFVFYLYMGTHWLVGAVAAVVATGVLEAAVVLAFVGTLRPTETWLKSRRFVLGPALVVFLVAVGLGLFVRLHLGSYQAQATRLELFNVSLWLAATSLLVLTSGILALSHVLGWSSRYEKLYRSLDLEERETAALKAWVESWIGAQQVFTATQLKEGVVIRVDKAGLGLVEEDVSELRYTFTFNKIRGYRGESPGDLGLRAGPRVRFTVTDQKVDWVELISRPNQSYAGLPPAG